MIRPLTLALVLFVSPALADDWPIRPDRALTPGAAPRALTAFRIGPRPRHEPPPGGWTVHNFPG